MFKREDIKAGYLLRCTHLKEGRQFNMTVIPCRRSMPLVLAFSDTIETKEGDLACCNKGADWLPLSGFDANLTHASTYRIDEVWGYAAPMRLMDNTTEGRERLWKRDDTKRMTLAEIEKAMGYKVKIVKDGDPAPALFKKSSLYAGMVVELRDSSKRLVVSSDEGLLLVGEPAVRPGLCSKVRPYARLSEYIDGLTRTRDSQHPGDIMKVWGRVASASYVEEAFTTTTVGRKLIWARDDTKHMTLEEIGKALGHKVEVVERVSAK